MGRTTAGCVLLVCPLLVLLLLAPCSQASEKDNKYKEGEKIKLWVNKVGPYNNPQETYNYYYLPFCKPHAAEKDEHSWGGLGEVLQGNELINSQLDFTFKVPVPAGTAICTQKLSAEDAAEFRTAIARHYWYEFFMDDLPMWGFVGEVSSADNKAQQVFLYTHKHFNISYNKDRIIHINLTSPETSKVAVEAGATVTFTYSVQWVPTDTPYGRRFERYLDYSFFEHKIHWFSIANSFMMVIFLTALVVVILARTLRRDYARYASAEGDLESLEADLNEETGWKLVHGDVFRPPAHRVLLAACVGTGVQLCLLGLSTILLTIAGTLFEERGTILTVFIVCYALTSFVGGYVSGGHYARMEGQQWIRALVATASLFPGIAFSIGAVLNTIAIAYGSLAAVPFGYIVLVLLLWAFLSFPLCILGTIIGRNWSSAPNYPCRVKRIPSPIPAKAWFLSPPVIALAGGLLPFGSIFIEMYFVFTSFWNYKVYYVYGFMLLVFLILLIVTVCVTIVGTYFLLNAENYHWHWTSFFMSASTSFYVFLYALHYFFWRTKMSGLFQTAYYFGYTFVGCVAVALACGSIGHIAAAAFIRVLFRNVKAD